MVEKIFKIFQDRPLIYVMYGLHHKRAAYHYHVEQLVGCNFYLKVTQRDGYNRWGEFLGTTKRFYASSYAMVQLRCHFQGQVETYCQFHIALANIRLKGEEDIVI
jgi:hypothetical protein